MTHSKPRHTESQHSNLINRTNQPKNKSLEKKSFHKSKVYYLLQKTFLQQSQRVIERKEEGEWRKREEREDFCVREVEIGCLCERWVEKERERDVCQQILVEKSPK